jgi:hypothetical protein
MLGCQRKAIDQALIQSPEIWAARIYASAALPDERLNARLVDIASTFAAKPTDSIPQACGHWAQAKATYRFIENERITMEALQQPVNDSTAKICAGLKEVFVIQDTSTLNYSNLVETTGLGPICENDSRGLLLHSALAVREDGVPLGLLHQQYWARETKAPGAAKAPKRRPIEEKESMKWIHGVRGARQAIADKVPEDQRPRLIHVFDREGDIYEAFQEIVSKGDGAVIRCAYNRRVEGEVAKAHESVHNAPLLGTVSIEVPRKKGQVARRSAVELRCLKLTLMNPNPSRCPDNEPISLHLVEVWEAAAPEGVTGLRWLLWSAEEVTTLEEALRVVRIYKLRWQIEEVHLCLKSGCRVEKLQFDTAERLVKLLVLFLPIAVRIVQLRTLARQQPQAACTLVLSRDEWRALWTYVKKKPPAKTTPIPSLAQVVRWIGRLGGHLGRKGDGMPGVRALWRGWRDLQLLTTLYQASRSSS